MIAEALSQWQAPKRTTRGGQPRYSDLAIETALTLGLVFGLRLRQAEGLLTSVLELMGLDHLAVPDHTTLSRRARTGRSSSRRQCRSLSAEGPAHVLIDSSGLEIYGAGQWLAEKHGVRSRRNCRKLHLALDADSGEIIAHVMTERDNRASQVEPLLHQVDVPVGQFTADGAYDGKPTYDAVSNHSADAVIVIPPRPTRWKDRTPSPLSHCT
jgi:IS5 family transposase